MKAYDRRSDPKSRAQLLRGLPIRNASGATIAEGALVYVSGWAETYKRFLVTLADANVAGASNALFVVRHPMLNNQNGVGWKTSRLQALNTSAGSVSDPVYLSATAGGWTLTAPSASGGVNQVVGRVAVDSTTVGEIEFNLELGLPDTSNQVTVGETLTIAAGGNLVVNSNSASAGALIPVGPNITGGSGSGTEVGGITGRVAGISMNLNNAANSLTGFRGTDIRLTDGGGGTNYVVGVQAVMYKTAGTNAGEMWAANFVGSLTGGKCENYFGVASTLTVGASMNLATNILNPKFTGCFYASTFIDTGATIMDGGGTAYWFMDAAYFGGILASAATNRRKADAAFVADITGVPGAEKTCTAGAAFKVTNHSSVASNQFDYGLDLYDSRPPWGPNDFAVADIRLGGLVGPVIMEGTSDPNASLTRPKGSLHIDTTNATLKINTDGGTTWAATG